MIDKTLSPPKIVEYERQQTAEAVKFAEAMTVRGWTGITDLFGADNFWQHRAGRIMPHEKAFDYYQASGKTPTPF